MCAKQYDPHEHAIPERRSQNGNIQPKREHVSRYFSEVGYTLYGMILTAHLDDFTNIGVTEREELRELLTRKGLPLQITESHLVISADLTHDGCAVMHFNDHLLTPYLKANLPRIHTRIRISDGGPNHLKLADLALHTSKQKVPPDRFLCPPPFFLRSPTLSLTGVLTVAG